MTDAAEIPKPPAADDPKPSAAEIPKPPAPAKPTPALMLQLPKVAVGALALSQVPWFVLIAEQFTGEQRPLAVWNLLVTLWVLGVCVALWRRFAPLFSLALITAWYEAIISTVYALTNEMNIMWFSMAASFTAIVAITKAREGLPGVKPARPASAEGETFGQWAKENVEAIVVAFIMALVIRCFCIEVFKIPSSSMEPTLLGDVTNEHRAKPGSSNCPAWWEHYGSDLENPRRTGDRIMVTKYFYAFSDIERYDVVVFKFPLNLAKNFIKRVVGLPGERLYVYHGNLFTDGGDKARVKEAFKVAHRPFRVQNSAWVSYRPDGAPFLSSDETFRDRWTALPLEKGMLYAESVVEDGRISTRENRGTRDVRYRFVRPSSHWRWEGNDARVAFDFELTSPTGELFASVQNDYGRFTLRLSTEGENKLQWHLPGSAEGQPRRTATLPSFQVEPDRRYRLDLGVYDGRAYARLDRELLGEIEVFKTRGELDALMQSDRVKNIEATHAFEFGARGTTFTARNLRLDRDFYYQRSSSSSSAPDAFREDTIVKILEGHYMMMGDNVGNSHDSRAWRETVYTLEDGTEIRAEGQEINPPGELDEAVKRLELDPRPDVYIRADKHGNEWALYKAESAPEDFIPRRSVGVLRAKDGEVGPKAFRFVDERYIVGKAFWIWWPMGRWFTLIR